MTVQELIERLKGMPSEMPVFLSGGGKSAHAATGAWINLVDSAENVIPQQQDNVAGYVDVVLIEGTNTQA